MDEINQIRLENPNSLTAQSFMLLKKWVSREGKSATSETFQTHSRRFSAAAGKSNGFLFSLMLFLSGLVLSGCLNHSVDQSQSDGHSHVTGGPDI